MDYYKKYLKYKKKYLISKKIFIGGNPSSIHIFKKLIHGGTPPLDSKPEIELSGGNIFCIAAAEILDKFNFQNKDNKSLVLNYLKQLKDIVKINLDYLQDTVQIGNINPTSRKRFEDTIKEITDELEADKSDLLKEKIGNIANKVSDLDFKLVKTGCWWIPRKLDSDGSEIPFTPEEAVLFVLARLQFLSGEGLDLSVPFPYTLLGIIVNSDAHKNIRIIKELEVIIFFQPTDPKTDKRIDRYIIQNLYYFLKDKDTKSYKDEDTKSYKDTVYHKNKKVIQNNNCLGDLYTNIVGTNAQALPSGPDCMAVDAPPQRGGGDHAQPSKKQKTSVAGYYPTDFQEQKPQPPNLPPLNINHFYDNFDLPQTPEHFNVIVENNNMNLDEDVEDEQDKDVEDDLVDKLERTLSDSIIKLDKLENYDLDDDDGAAVTATAATDTLLLNWSTVNTTKNTIETELKKIYRDRSILEEKCKHCINLTNKDKDPKNINGAFKRMLINISKYCKVYFQIFNKTNHTREKFLKLLHETEPFLKYNDSIDCINLMIECLENKKNEVALKTQYNVICLLLLQASEEEEEEIRQLAMDEEEKPIRPYQILKKRIHAIQKLLNDLLEKHLHRLSIDTHIKEQLHKVANIVKNIITDTTTYDWESHEGRILINKWFKNIRTNYEKFIKEIDEPCIKDAIKDELDSTTSFTGTLIGNDTKRHKWTGVSFNKDFKDRLKETWGENDTFTKGSKLGISIVSSTNCGHAEQGLEAAGP